MGEMRRRSQANGEGQKEPLSAVRLWMEPSPYSGSMPSTSMPLCTK